MNVFTHCDTVWSLWTNHSITRYLKCTLLTLNVSHTHTQYSELLGEILPHMKNNCLFTLLEVGVGVKGLQIADQDIVAHFIVNLQQRYICTYMP